MSSIKPRSTRDLVRDKFAHIDRDKMCTALCCYVDLLAPAEVRMTAEEFLTRVFGAASPTTVRNDVLEHSAEPGPEAETVSGPIPVHARITREEHRELREAFDREGAYNDLTAGEVCLNLVAVKVPPTGHASPLAFLVRVVKSDRGPYVDAFLQRCTDRRGWGIPFPEVTEVVAEAKPVYDAGFVSDGHQSSHLSPLNVEYEGTTYSLVVTTED